MSRGAVSIGIMFHPAMRSARDVRFTSPANELF